MQLTRIAIYRPVTTTMFALGLIFLGVISYRELPIQRLPEVTFPSMFYYAWLEEGEISPEETNDQMTRPFEKLVASLPGVKEMRSYTSSGEFYGFCRFDQNTDMRFRVIELQDKAAKWAAGNRNLHFEVIPQSTEQDSGQLMQLVLSVPAGQEARIGEVTDLISRKLKSIDGIYQVRISGDMEQSLTLQTDRDALYANGLDVNELRRAINARAGEKQWLGTLKEGRISHPVELESRIETLAALLALPVDKEGIHTLGALARPTHRVTERDSIYRINGKKAVHVSVNMEKDRNAVRMARTVRARLEEMKSQMPPGFELVVLEDVAEDLEEMMKNLVEMAATGALLAMLVLLVFIRSLRVAAVVLITIPASILITFNIMYGMGLTINILSLMGLTAGVGMLVDNSIVVVENVFRHARHQRDPREAAWLGSREVGRAILISTMTNLVVFVPLVYIDDEMVLLMRDMALSLIFPMTVSLGVAITLIPTLTARMIKTGRTNENGLHRSDKSYLTDKSHPLPLRLKTLFTRHNPWHRPHRRGRNFFMEFILYCSKGSIRHPVRLFFTIAIALLLTLFAAVIKLAIQRYNPEDQTRELVLYGKAPVGSDLKAADRMFQEKEAQIRKELAESDVFESFSSRFDRDGGQIALKVAKKYQSLPIHEFYDAYTRKWAGGNEYSGFRFRPYAAARGAVQAQQAMISRQFGRSGRESVAVTGENMEAMQRAAEQVEALLKNEAEVSDVFLDTPPSQPEVHFSPDLELFKIFKTDPTRLTDDFAADDPKGIDTALVLRDGPLDQRVRLRVLDPRRENKAKARQTLGERRQAKVLLADGNTAPLETLGTFSIQQAIPTIVKEDRQRNIKVAFNLKSSYYQKGMEKDRQARLLALQEKVLKLRLPSGVSAQLAGTLDEVDKEKQIWKKVVWSAILAIYFVMAFFFESLLSPFLILWTLPLAFIGGVWGIILFDARLDTVAMLGTIILAGLVVNNGILLIEYTQQLQSEQRYRRPRALLSAIVYRVRPIMMTSLTTILGLLPILFSKESEEVARSLASVLIGGMLVSTLLTLVVIPTFFNVAAIGMARVRAMRIGLSGWLGARRGWRMPRIFRSRKSAPVPAFAELPPAAEDAPLLIEIDNVSKIYPLFTKKKLAGFIPSRTYSYGRRPPRGNNALKNVSLTIQPGMFGLLGPNGAGKTTLMKIITGLIGQTYGVVRVGGIDLREDRETVRSLISYLPQNFGVYESLTLNQYLEFFAPFYGLNDREERRRRIEEVSAWVGLDAVRDKPMKRFSGGMRQRAGIAQILLRPAPIIIVDEPTAGLDPVERVRFRLLLSQLARTRIVVLSTHIVDDITSSCRQVAVLNRGTVVYQGDVDQITATARGVIWDVVWPADQVPPIPPRQILYKKHVDGGILYHYFATEPLPDSTPVEANFEDAYVALLMQHDAAMRPHPDHEPPRPHHAPALQVR